MKRSALAVVGTLAGALASLAAVSFGVAQTTEPVGTPLATTLVAPTGLSPLPGGSVLVAEAASGSVLRLSLDGSQEVVLADLPVTEKVTLGEARTVGVVAAVSDGFGGYRYLLGGAPEEGFSSLYRVDFAGNRQLLADFAAYERVHNSDGRLNQAGEPEILSDPYDLALNEFGDVFVSDSAANAVLRVNTDNVIETYGVLPEIPNPSFPAVGDEFITQSPSGIVIGPDQAVYVATMTSFPFPQGAAKVYRFRDGNSDGDALDPGEFSVVASGLTAASDVAFGEDGLLLVSQLSTDVSAAALGRVSRVVEGEPVTIVHLLRSPSSLVVTEEGRLLVTEQSVGRVADVTESPAGGFLTPIAEGVTLTSYGGGPVAQLGIEVADAGGASVAVTVGGEFIVLVPGAPSFVNTAFESHFPTGVPSGTVLLVVGD